LARPQHSQYPPQESLIPEVKMPQNDTLFPPMEFSEWGQMTSDIKELKKFAEAAQKWSEEIVARIEQLERTIEEWRVFRLPQIEKGLKELEDLNT
jgi:hypothetical protein